MNPKATLQLGLKATKVAKPIEVQLVQGDATPAEEVTFGIKLLCDGTEFKEDLMIITLNGFDAILGNTFLDVYCIDILRGGSKLKVITRLVDKSISLEVDYQSSLLVVGINLISMKICKRPHFEF